jgi:hypothetical protein
MLWLLHVETVAVPESLVELKPSILTLSKTNLVPDELYITGSKLYVCVVLQPQSKFVGFFVSCEYEYETPSIVAMPEGLLCKDGGMFDMLKNTGTTATKFIVFVALRPA